jgi:hypothetical protein
VEILAIVDNGHELRAIDPDGVTLFVDASNSMGMELERNGADLP